MPVGTGRGDRGGKLAPSFESMWHGGMQPEIHSRVWRQDQLEIQNWKSHISQEFMNSPKKGE